VTTLHSRLRGRVQVALGILLLAACDSPPDTANSSTPTDESASSATATPIRSTIGGTALSGRLFDNSTANDLAAQLPLTLTFRDLNGVEKISPLPRKLSTEAMPSGDDPEIGDIGYWAPEGNLVFYYGDVGYWTGIMRIGEFDGDPGAIAQQSGDFTATVERAAS
jgi:hypothetical protein